MAFNINAHVILQGPKNVRAVANRIKNQLGNVSVNVKINAPKRAQQQVQKTSQSVQNLQRNTAKLNATSKTASQNLKQVGQSSAKAANAMQMLGKETALTFKRFAAAGIVTLSVFKLTNAIAEAVPKALEFQREVNKIGQVTGLTTSQLGGFKKAVDELSKSLGVDANELAATGRIFAQTGQTIDQVEASLRAVARASLTPSFGDMANTAEGLIASLAQFNIQAKKSEQVLASINAVSKKFAVESEDIIAAIRRMGGVFSMAANDAEGPQEALNQLIAIFTSVRSTTRESAETIATGLRTIFTRIQRPRTIAFLDELGIKVTDVNGKFIGMFPALEKLSKSLKGLDNLQLAKVTEELGGVRQVGKLIPAIKQFDKTRKAFEVAQKGASEGLGKDVSRGLEPLIKQFEKVQKRFHSLIRTVAESSTFKAFAKVALGLANAFLKIGETLTPLLPAITAFATMKIAKGIGDFGKGFFGSFGAGGGIAGAGKGLGSAVTGGGTAKTASNTAALQGLDANLVTLSGHVTSLGTQMGTLGTTHIDGLGAKIDPLREATNFLKTDIANLRTTVSSVLTPAIRSLTTAVSSAKFGGGFGGPGGRRGRKGFARGGLVPGRGDHDTVPAMLTPGEFVVNKKSTAAAGVSKLAKINNNRFADGGRIHGQIDRRFSLGVVSSDPAITDATLVPGEGMGIGTNASGVGGVGLGTVQGESSQVARIIEEKVRALQAGKTAGFLSLAGPGGGARKNALVGGVKLRQVNTAKFTRDQMDKHLADIAKQNEKIHQVYANPKKPKSGPSPAPITLNETDPLTDALARHGYEDNTPSGLAQTKKSLDKAKIGGATGGVSIQARLGEITAPNSSVTYMDKQAASIFDDQLDPASATSKVVKAVNDAAVDFRNSPIASSAITSLAGLIEPTAINSMRGYLFEAFTRVASGNVGTAATGVGTAFDVPSTAGYEQLFSSLADPMELKQMYNVGSAASAMAKAIATYPNMFSVVEKAKGGSIKGAGTDTVPALLTPGEFVINRSSAQSYGYGNLQNINKYAQGGIVESGKHFYGPGPPGMGKLFGGLVKKTKPLAAGMGKLKTGVNSLTAATGSATQAMMPMAQNMMMLSMMMPSVIASFEGLKDGIGLSDILNLGMTIAFILPTLKNLGPTLSGLAIGAQAFGKGFKRGGEQKMGLTGRLNRGVAGATKGKLDINRLARHVEVGTRKALSDLKKLVGRKFDSLKKGFANFKAGLGGAKAPVGAQMDWNKFQKSMKGSGLKSGKGAGTFSEAFKAQKAPTKGLKLGQSVRDMGKSIKGAFKTGAGHLAAPFKAGAKMIGTGIKVAAREGGAFMAGGFTFFKETVQLFGQMGDDLASNTKSLSKHLKNVFKSGAKTLGGALKKIGTGGGELPSALKPGAQKVAKAASPAAAEHIAAAKNLGKTIKESFQNGIRRVGPSFKKAFKDGASLTGKIIKAPFEIGGKLIKTSASMLTKASKGIFRASKSMAKSAASLTKTSAKFGASAVKGLGKVSARLAKGGKAFGLKAVANLQSAGSALAKTTKNFWSATKNLSKVAKDFGSKAIKGFGQKTAQLSKAGATFGMQAAKRFTQFSTQMAKQGAKFGLKHTKNLARVSSRLAKQGASFGLKLTKNLTRISASLGKKGAAFGLKHTKNLSQLAGRLTKSGAQFGLKHTKNLAQIAGRLAKQGLKFGVPAAKNLAKVSANLGKHGAKFGLKLTKNLAQLTGRLAKQGVKFGVPAAKSLAKVSVNLGKHGAKFGIQTIKALGPLAGKFAKEGSRFGVSAIKNLGKFSANLGKQGATFGSRMVKNLAGSMKSFGRIAKVGFDSKGFAKTGKIVAEAVGHELKAAAKGVGKFFGPAMKDGSKFIGRTLKSGAKAYGQAILKFPNIMAKSIKTTLPSGMSKVVKPTIGQSLATPKGQKLVGQGKNILKHMQKGAKAVGREFKGVSKTFIKELRHQGQILGKIAGKGAEFGSKAAKGMTRAAATLGKAGQKIGAPVLKSITGGAKLFGKQVKGMGRILGPQISRFGKFTATFGKPLLSGLQKGTKSMAQLGKALGGKGLTLMSKGARSLAATGKTFGAAAVTKLQSASVQFGKAAGPMAKQLAGGLKTASKKMATTLGPMFKKSADFMGKRLSSAMRAAAPAGGAAMSAGAGAARGAGAGAANMLKAMKQGAADISKKVSSGFSKAAGKLGKTIVKTGGRFAIGASQAISRGGDFFGKKLASLKVFGKDIGTRISTAGGKVAGKLGTALSKSGKGLLRGTKSMVRVGKDLGTRFAKAGGKVASKLQSTLGPAFSKGASLLGTSLQKVGSLGATVGKSVGKASSKMGAVINGAFKSSSEFLRNSISTAGTKLSEFGGVLKGRIGEAAKSFTTKAGSMFSTASKGLKGAITGAGSKLSSAFSGLKGTFTSISGSLGKNLKTVFTKSSTVLKTAIGSSFKGGLNVAKGFGESIKRGAGTFGNSIKGVFQNAGKTISTKFGAVTSGLGKQASRFSGAIAHGSKKFVGGLASKFSGGVKNFASMMKTTNANMIKSGKGMGATFSRMIPSGLKKGASNLGAGITKRMTPGLTKVLGPKLGAKIAGGMVKGGPWGLVASLVADPMIDFVGGGIRDLISGKAVTIAPGVTGRRNESVTGAAIGGGVTGAAKGAVTGALIGSIFGPLGTIVGTAVGALAGFVDGLVKGAAAQREFQAYDKLKDTVEDAIGPLTDVANMTSFDPAKLAKSNAATTAVFDDMAGAYKTSIDKSTIDMYGIWDAVNPFVVTDVLADGMGLAAKGLTAGVKMASGALGDAVGEEALHKAVGATAIGLGTVAVALSPIGPAAAVLAGSLMLASPLLESFGVDTEAVGSKLSGFTEGLGKGIMKVAEFGAKAGAAVVDFVRPGVSTNERKLANTGAEGFWAQGASTFDNTLSRIPIISALTGAKGRVKERAKEGTAKIEREALDKTLTMMTDDFVDAVNQGFSNAVATATETLADIDMAALDAIIDIDFDAPASAMTSMISPSEQFATALKDAGTVLGDTNVLFDQFANVVKTRVLAAVKADVEASKTMGDEKGERTAQLAGRMVMGMEAKDLAEMTEEDIEAKAKTKLTKKEKKLGVTEEGVAEQLLGARAAAQAEIQLQAATARAAKEAAKLASVIDSLGQGLDKFTAIAEQGVAKFESFASSFQEGFDRAFSTEASMLSTEGSRTNAFANMETATPEEIDKAFARIEANAGGGPGGANAAGLAGLKETAKMSTALPMALKKATETITSGKGTQKGFSTAEEADKELMKALKDQGVDTTTVPAVVLDQMSKSIKATFAARQSASGGTGPIQMTDLLEEGGEVATMLGELADKTKESLAAFTDSLNQFESAVIEAANIQIQMAEKIKEADLKKIAIADQLAQITGRDKGKSKLDVATEKFQRQQSVQLGATGVLGTSSFIPGAAPGTGLDATALGERRASLEARSAGIREKLGIGADVNPADADLGNVADMQPLVDELASVETALGGTKTAMEQLASDTTRLAAINETLQDIERDKMSAQDRLLNIQKELAAAMKAGDMQKVQELQEEIRMPMVALEKFQRGEQLTNEESASLAQNADMLADFGHIARDQVGELKSAVAAGFAASDLGAQFFGGIMDPAAVAFQQGEGGIARGGMLRPGEETSEEARLRAEATDIAQQQTDAVDIGLDLSLAEVAKMQKRYNEELAKSKQALFDAGTALKQFREGAAGTAAAGAGGGAGAGGASAGGAGGGATPPGAAAPPIKKPVPVVVKPSPGGGATKATAGGGTGGAASRGFPILGDLLKTDPAAAKAAAEKEVARAKAAAKKAAAKKAADAKSSSVDPDPTGEKFDDIIGVAKHFADKKKAAQKPAFKLDPDWQEKGRKALESGDFDVDAAGAAAQKAADDLKDEGQYPGLTRKHEPFRSQNRFSHYSSDKSRNPNRVNPGTLPLMGPNVKKIHKQYAAAMEQPALGDLPDKFSKPAGASKHLRTKLPYDLKGITSPPRATPGFSAPVPPVRGRKLSMSGDPGETERRIASGNRSSQMQADMVDNQQFAGAGGTNRMIQQANAAAGPGGLSATDFSSVGEGLANSIANIPEAINLNANVGQLEVVLNTNNLTSQFEKLVEVAALKQVQEQLPAIIEQTSNAVKSQMNN